MEFHQTDWLGRWNNFESYLTSTDPHMQAAWRDAEGVAAALPMFKNGAKAFWQMACVTTRYECKSNNHRKPVNSHVPL